MRTNPSGGAAPLDGVEARHADHWAASMGDSGLAGTGEVAHNDGLVTVREQVERRCEWTYVPEPDRQA